MVLNLSMVVVTYNCEPFIRQFLTELLSSLEPFEGYEILVFDNNSSDNTVVSLNDFAADVSLTKSNENVGFAKANNILIKKAKYENILLLNPDVFGFDEPFWKKLFSLWDRQNPLFIRLVNPDMTYQDCVGDVVSVKRILKSAFNLNGYSARKEPIEVGMGIMAFLLVNKNILHKVGLLSEQFHMYSEDMDWCFRAKKKGFRNTFDPRLSLIHTGGGSSSSRWKEKEIVIQKYKSEKIFIDVHYTGLHKTIMKLFADAKILKVKWTK